MEELEDPESGTEGSTSLAPIPSGLLVVNDPHPAGRDSEAIDIEETTIDESPSPPPSRPAAGDIESIPEVEVTNKGNDEMNVATTTSTKSESPVPVDQPHEASDSAGVLPESMEPQKADGEQGEGVMEQAAQAQGIEQAEFGDIGDMNSQESFNNVLLEDFLVPFEGIQNRQLVREELEKMREIEEKELKKFWKLRRFTPGSRMFPDLKVSGGYHTIAFKVQDFFDPHKDPELKPYPSYFSSRWSPDYVPMPCCEENERVVVKVTMYPRTSISGDVLEPKKVKTQDRVKCWDRIETTLAQAIDNVDDLNHRINFITDSTTAFNVLKHTIEEVMTSAEAHNFFSEVLPVMVKLCLALPKVVTCPIPLLKRHKNYSISLTQKQIASLMANAFFCTFPARLENEDNFPSINFDELYSCDPTDDRMHSMAQKLRCIIHYFERIAMRDEVHNGVLTFTRKCNVPARCPNWSASTKKMKQLVALCNGTIESDGAGMLQVDFANRFLGGGVLGRGAVQEEILFVIYPELLISRVFTEKLYAGEALLITGCERFSNYVGYSSTFTYAGDFQDSINHDSKGRLQTQIIAIDALFIQKSLIQFNPRLMERELNKAYAGFSLPYHAQNMPVAVASGKWGCGAFNGNPELKAVLQLMAATEAGRDIAIFTFGDSDYQQSLLDMYEFIQTKTVGEVWKLLKQYYSVFCAGNANDDQPPNYTLSQFFDECASANDVDMGDSAPNSQQAGSSSAPPARANGWLSVSDEVEMVPASPETKSETVIDIDDADDIDFALAAAFSPSPWIPVKRVRKDSNERPLSDLYSEPPPMRSPAKIGVADLDDERFDDPPPLPFRFLREPVPMTSLQALRVKRLASFVNSDSDDESDENGSGSTERTLALGVGKDPKRVETPGKGFWEKTGTGEDKSKDEVTRIVTDEDYRSAWVSPSRTFRIPKPNSSKRKLSLSPSQNRARPSFVRQKQDQSPSKGAVDVNRNC